MKANRLLRRILTTTTPSLSRSTASAATAAASAKPKKKWKFFSGDPPPPPAPKSQPPKTIQFREDICNSASFVGTIAEPVRRIDAASGGVQVGACTSLLVKDSTNSNSIKILLKMWNEMAEIGLEHIKQNDFLHVSGRVESYTKTNENEKSQTCCEVIVKKINYVAESEHSPIDKDAGQSDLGGNYVAKSELSPIDESRRQSDKNTRQLDSGGESFMEKRKARFRLWQLFFNNPSEWDDNRTNKVKPTYPDFKHRDSGQALWINSYDPPWVKEQLQQLNSKFATKDQNPPKDEPDLEKYRDRLRLWQLFFTNPSEWYDHRKTKEKPNQPDFKHKETGEALWINAREPPWVKMQLQRLDSKSNGKGVSTSSFSKYV